MGRFFRERLIETEQYDMHLAEFPSGLFYGGFTVHRQKPSPQFNVFSESHCLVVIGDIPQPIWVRSGDRYISLEKGWALYASPYSIIDWVLPPGTSQIHTFGTVRDLAIAAPEFPFVFSFHGNTLPQSASDVERILQRTSREIFVGRNFQPDPLARKTKEWISQTYDSSLRITDLANKLGVSRENLSRTFKKCYGMKIQDYRKSLRIDSTMKKLIFEGKNVTEAAFDSGFDNLGNFFRQFKDNYDATPKKFHLQPHIDRNQELSP